MNLTHLLFNHLRTSVKETREEERTKRDWIPLGRLISDILTENKLIDHLTEAQEINSLEATVGKQLNAKNLKKMKIIENIKKEPSVTSFATISSRRILLDNFPMFSEIDSKPEIILRYLDASKADGTSPDLNIQDLQQKAPEVVLKKNKKRKAAAEGSSQRTPKAAKKRGNPSSVTVLDSVSVSTSVPIPTQSEIPTPQTFDDFDIGFDPSETLTLRGTHSLPINPNIETTQPKLAKVLLDIETFDQHISAPIPVNPNSNHFRSTTTRNSPLSITRNTTTSISSTRNSSTFSTT